MDSRFLKVKLSMYDSVVITGKESEWRKVISGVHQGSVLGPILFLIFVSDFTNEVENNMAFFADDTKL